MSLAEVAVQDAKSHLAEREARHQQLLAEEAAISSQTPGVLAGGGGLPQIPPSQARALAEAPGGPELASQYSQLMEQVADCQRSMAQALAT
eukprot:4775437-Lingulodinium_polyedra.AAC.1